MRCRISLLAMLSALTVLSTVTARGAAPGAVAGSGQSAAETVVRNARVYTVDADRTWAEALAITDGKLVFVGSNAGAEPFIGAGTRVIDARGRLVLPGIQDAHLHPIEGGSLAGGDCELKPTAAAENHVAALRRCAERPTPTGWILGYGYRIDALLDAKRSPREILDEAIPDRPALILEETSHSAWANSKALAAAGIDASTPQPRGGYILADADGTPNGILLEGASDTLFDIALRSTPAVDQANYEGLLWTLGQLAENGITSVADARTYWSRGHVGVWDRAERQRTLTVRAVLGLWAYPDADDTTQLAELISRYRPEADRLVRITQVKLYADGLIQNMTAALIEPYRRHLEIVGERGMNYFAPTRLTRYVTELQAVGFDVHIHTIGDRGVREALDAIESAAARGSRADTRHQLAHLELIHPQDRPRFAQLGVFANFQTSSEFVEKRFRFEAAEFVGRKRIRRDFLPIGQVLEAGGDVVLSSDWDVGDMSPFVGMQRALTLGKQRLRTVADAVAAYTITPARLLRHESVTGSLEVGKWADLIIVDKDIFRIAKRRIGKTRVLLTMLEGREVYRAGNFPR